MKAIHEIYKKTFTPTLTKMGNGLSKTQTKPNVLEAIRLGIHSYDIHRGLQEINFDAIHRGLQEGSILKCSTWESGYEEMAFLAYLSLKHKKPFADLFEVLEDEARLASGFTMYDLLTFLKERRFNYWLNDPEIYQEVFSLSIEIGVILTEAGFFHPIKDDQLKRCFGDTEFVISDPEKRRMFARSGLIPPT